MLPEEPSGLINVTSSDTSSTFGNRNCVERGVGDPSARWCHRDPAGSHEARPYMKATRSNCHRLSGKGDGVTRQICNPQPCDLTKSRATDEEMFSYQVRVPGTWMVSLKKTISER